MLKRLSLVMAIAALGVCLAGAADKPAISRENFKSLVLHDVQGLSGGRDVYLTQNGMVIQVVRRPSANERGLQEKRFVAKLDEKQFDKLLELLNTHDFLHMEGSKRPGIPDESRPTLTLTLSGGETKSVFKWAGDKNEHFDPIYLWLLELVTSTTKDAKPVAEGNHDHAWRPEGFEIKK